MTRGFPPRYEDTGCYLFPSCLECPLPKCKDEMTQTQLATFFNKDRDSQIRLLRKLGHRRATIAQQFHISKHTVSRICATRR